MATERIDIGVIMGSQCQSIFLEYVDRYPGARHLYELIESSRCSCGREACVRDRMQEALDRVSGGDKNEAAKFIREACRVRTFQGLEDLAQSFIEKGFRQGPGHFFIGGLDKFR